MNTVLLAALEVMIVAGGAEPAHNFNAHAVHVRSLTHLLASRGVSKDHITLFWADGVDPQPDRAVRRLPEVPGAWLIWGTEIDAATDPGDTLEDTQFPGYRVQPAKRSALGAWIKQLGERLEPGSTLLIAVTDHGSPDPEGGLCSRIDLWGETWSVDELARDLEPIPSHVRIVLWMSQCHSGGFAELHAVRPNLCGVFSTTAHRPAYGCFPELAARTDVGHFMRLVDALSRHPTVWASHHETLLTDDTPDVPLLTSDLFVAAAVSEGLRSAGLRVDIPGEVDEIVDGLIDDLGIGLTYGEAPEHRLIDEIAKRYRLGDVTTYAATAIELDRIEQALYALDLWSWTYLETLDRARIALTEHVRTDTPSLVVETLALDERPRSRLDARRRWVGQVETRLRTTPRARARLRALRRRTTQVDRLVAQLDVQAAAALRVAYLHFRLAAAAVLDDAEKAHLTALRACEQAPVLSVESGRPTGILVALTTPLASDLGLLPVGRNLDSVARLHPPFYGVDFEIVGEDHAAHIHSVLPRGPAARAGVRSGDRVVALDGSGLTDDRAFAERLLLAPPNRSMRWTLRRADAATTVVVIPVPAPPPPDPPRTGDPVPELSIVGVDGRLPSIGAGQSVVLFFWSPECAPCRDAVPGLRRWARRQEATVIAIATDDRQPVTDYLTQNPGFPFAVALDPFYAARGMFAVAFEPVFVHIDRKGRLTDEGEGFDGEIPLGRRNQALIGRTDTQSATSTLSEGTSHKTPSE